MARKKKKKHDKILMLAESKSNSIEALISQALYDLNITHEEFKMILNEKDKKNGGEKQENVKLNNI